MRLKRLLRFSVLVVLGYFATLFVVGVFVAEGTLHPGKRPLVPNDETLANAIAQNHESELADVAILARDGITLSAWSLRPRKSNGNTVLLLHGLGDNRIGMIGYAELFLVHGFNVLMPDARAHGASGGKLATYGLLESNDIRRWFDWIQERQHPDCIFGFGESMGAAQLLKSLQAETHFCAVAAESPFCSFREIAYDRVGQFFHTGPWLGRTILRPVLEAAFAYARWKYKLNFEQLSPDEAVAGTATPVFLIHGQNDRNIPIRHSRRIAVDNRNLVLWEVPDTDHCGAISTAPAEFERRVIGWFEHNQGHKQTASSVTLGHAAPQIATILAASRSTASAR